MAIVDNFDTTIDEDLDELNDNIYQFNNINSLIILR
jgi:hypothetical protein